MKFPARIFSGIQPTGTLHLGNYFGAVKRWSQSLKALPASDPSRFQENIFSIVDLHAITLPQDPKSLQSNILDMAASLVACGVDPDRCILFQQSRVQEHSELSWILGCQISLARLNGLSQFKDKSAKLKEVPLGLFTYPVLQSADILLYKGTRVPVGEDNIQNVEIAQYLARAFNHDYGKVFPNPKVEVLDDPSARVRSLRKPDKKMSKSDTDWRSCIYITDSPEDVLEKCKKAVTDLKSEITFDPADRPGVSNLVTIHSNFTGQTTDEVIHSVRDLTTAQYKLHLAEVISSNLQPIQKKFEDLKSNPEHLEVILKEGSEKARTIAAETMEEVKRAVGLSR